MISVDEALNKILSHIHPLGSEKVSLLDALGRVIAEEICAPRDIPPFNNSGMDGYAVKWEDVKNATADHSVRLEVIEDLPAGSVPSRILGKGQAIRIMTGAPVPSSADTIIPVEETKGEGRSVAVLRALPKGSHIRRAGGDVEKGDCIIGKRDLLHAGGIGMIASTGMSFVSVYQRPLVAILCTGEELVDVDEDLDGVKIVSSNSYTLAAQVKDCGAIPVQLGIARDRKEEIEEKLRQGMRADVLISSAGISVGDYDFVKDALKELGVEMIFWRVAMKPGKPVAFGTLQGKPVFGLPGNPVSSMVAFEEFVRPALLKMMGHHQLFRPVVEAVLKEEIKKEPGRRHFIRSSVTYEDGRFFVTTTGPQGSDKLTSMVKASGLMIIPEDREIVKAGETVEVQVLDCNLLSTKSQAPNPK
jgi:molybdopterin molybdotransferase